MKRLLIVILCFSVLGCTSPKVLRPIATQNQKNIKNYVQNNHRIYTITKKLLIIRLDLELNKIRTLVQKDIMNGYKFPIDRNVLTSEANKISSILQTINSLSIKTDEASQSQLISKKNEVESLRRLHPVAYDVAIGKFTEDIVFKDHEQIKITRQRYAGQDRKMRLRLVYPLLDKYTLVAELIETRQALIGAYDKYLDTLLEQGRIAVRHAEAVVLFTEEKFDSGNAILQTIGDVKIQESILEIIRDNSGEERSAKAKEILKELTASEGGAQ